MVRESAFWLWIVGGFPAIGVLAFRKTRSFPRLRLGAVAMILGSGIAAHGHWAHEENRQRVLNTPRERMPELGKHLVIGWLGFEETRALAAKGAIAGVFLTARDFPKKATAAEIRSTVEALQSARRQAGLPPLWVATDQEGGPVSKLSPPLDHQPALGTLLVDLDGPGLAAQPGRAAEIVRRTRNYADIQGRALAEAGINLNFSPVVDLRPAAPAGILDRNSRIANRALAADPETVALAGETYVRTLAKHGITGVLKHFPGLGRVPEDTHHFAASLDASPEDLQAKDWLPFREISRRTNAGIMLGHVRLTTLDPEHPASCSSKIARGLLRETWGMTGLLVTDDFSMAPIFHGPGGIIRAAENSLAAGVDLILLSYDPEAAYDLLGHELENRTSR